MFTAEPSNSVPLRRRWLRFSLRTFLLVLTALCIWLGVKVNQARQQKEAVEALRMLGFYVNYEHWRTDADPAAFDSSNELDVPLWLRDLTGDDFFQKVVAIRVLPPSTDGDYVHLAALPHIEALHLRGNDITDAGLAHLPRPDRLIHFSAGSTFIGDGFVKRLANAKRLATLELSSTHVTDEGLLSLPRLPKLKRLGLGNTQIGDKGLAAALKDTSSLEVLVLGGTQITDKSLALLKNAKRLRWLSLENTQISDTGLVHLKSAKQLISLSLEQTRVTDAGLRHLHGLPALESVKVDGTLVTPDGMAALKAATPSVDRRLREIIKLRKRPAQGGAQLPPPELPVQ